MHVFADRFLTYNGRRPFLRNDWSQPEGHRSVVREIG